MTNEIQKFKDLLDSSNRILITSHISPDPDAVSSTLLLGTTLKENFPDKQISMVLEEKPDRLDFLPNYDEIKFQPIINGFKEYNPNLLIVVDTNNFDRVSRNQSDIIREYIKENQNDLKVAIIDHHQPKGQDISDLYVNIGSIAEVQDLYEILFDNIGFNKPLGYVMTTLIGIYSDSGGFSYPSSKYKDTFRIVSDLIENGGNLETIKRHLSSFSEDEMTVIKELINNLSHINNFTYSYLGDEFVSKWLKDEKSIPSMNAGCKVFIDQFIRNIDNRVSGFVVYPNILSGENQYAVSFRSIGGGVDVSKIANKMGGGGHIPAAGVKFEAKNINEALNKVSALVENSGNS